MEEGAPAATIRIFRSVAIGAEPKTGPEKYERGQREQEGPSSILEIREAFSFASFPATSLLVSGWTLVVSTNTFLARFAANKISVTMICSASSLLVWTSS